ncbi:MAG: hypothetical protein OXH75_14950, partial [Acidobacteria bacterium]|nr:hypothetical protein [Acidobacteriota bacterium]
METLRFLGSARKCRLAVLAATVLAATVVAVVLLDCWRGGSRTLVDRTPAEMPASETVPATAARIAAESHDPETPPPAVRTAPESAAEQRDGRGERAHAPEGYAVVRHRGRMAGGGTMAHRDDDRAAGPDWLRAADGPERVAATAAGAG